MGDREIEGAAVGEADGLAEGAIEIVGPDDGALEGLNSGESGIIERERGGEKKYMYWCATQTKMNLQVATCKASQHIPRRWSS